MAVKRAFNLKNLNFHVLLLAIVLSVSFGNTFCGFVNFLSNEVHKSAQCLWDELLNFIGDDEFNLYFYGSLIVTASSYWAISLPLLITDLLNEPKSIAQYKVVQESNDSFDRKHIFHVLKHVIFNQSVIGVPYLFVGQYWMFDLIHQRPNVRILPPFSRMAFDFFMCLAATEVCFYYIHRLLHHRIIYKYVHKKHHKTSATMALAAVYCHPLEYLFGNLVPLSAGFTLAGPHIAIVYTWILFVVFTTCNDHSGYHFPFIPSQEFHYFHHQQFNNCFGVFGIMDYLHGTDKQFRKSAAFKRHTIFFSTKPISQKYPSNKMVDAKVIDN